MLNVGIRAYFAGRPVLRPRAGVEVERQVAGRRGKPCHARYDAQPHGRERVAAVARQVAGWVEGRVARPVPAPVRQQAPRYLCVTVRSSNVTKYSAAEHSTIAAPALVLR